MIYDKEPVPPTPPVIYLPVGGRIFYIHSDNGATYKFYDANKVELTTQTVEGLANAVYYTVSGTPSADKFYVYNNKLMFGRLWGKNVTVFNVTTDTIGSGKTNSATCLAATGWEDNSIWTYINTVNTANTGGCSDWYIGSTKELDELKNSGLVNWFSNKHILSSVECTITLIFVGVLCWHNESGSFKWQGVVKNEAPLYCCAIRSF